MSFLSWQFKSWPPPSFPRTQLINSGRASLLRRYIKSAMNNNYRIPWNAEAMIQKAPTLMKVDHRELMDHSILSMPIGIGQNLFVSLHFIKHFIIERKLNTWGNTWSLSRVTSVRGWLTMLDWITKWSNLTPVVRMS